MYGSFIVYSQTVIFIYRLMAVLGLNLGGHWLGWTGGFCKQVFYIVKCVQTIADLPL